MSKIELVFELIAVTCLTGCMCGFHKRLGYKLERIYYSKWNYVLFIKEFLRYGFSFFHYD